MKNAAYRQAVSAQIAAHPEIGTLLLSTGDKKIEAEYPTDPELGIGADGLGENMLGNLLMSLRVSLRA